MASRRPSNIGAWPHLTLALAAHPSARASRREGGTGGNRGLPFVQRPYTGAELVRQVRAVLDR